MIRAKLSCTSVTKTAHSEQVTLQPVYSVDKDSPNYSWSQATPGGKFEMTVSNPQAFGHFVPGAEYLVSFEPAG